ncbi:unnamed protein product [Adineta steineri]|uniref:Uncharacterized protein n=1 Tax=Adineta steineri TaxID=433720 RepID=A0A814C8F5_9BILA|nr:unnamed protein product [Adineta steineri]CAF0939109.1 unnamed protein product [Adineta steineri]CAF1045882.1 unnamed protein product [Adineta steineri]
MANDKHSQHLPDGEHFDIVTTTTSKNDSNITLVWVDEEAMNLASPKYRVTIDMLQKICGNNYKLYDCVDLFLIEVECMTKTMKIIVVMSGLFASSILPKLSASLLRELSSIFIFCKEYDEYKYLLKKCRKIIAICSDDHSLKKAIENELQSPTDFVIMNQNLIPIFSLKEEYQDFLWYKLHIEVLTHYPWSRDNTQKMLMKYGVTAAGGHGSGNATNQLSFPYGIFVDDNQTIVIADWGNDRVMQWRVNDTDGQVVAGGHGAGNRLDQLKGPSDVLIDKETNSLIICDRWNERVVRWSRQYGTTEGEILLDNIFCFGLFMDDQRYLYVSNTEKDEIRQYQIGDKNGTVVAGGHGNGNGLNQLSNPYYFFVDRQQNVYVSDSGNHRVVKWNKDAKEGLVVITSEATGDAIWQLGIPEGLFIDTLGILYVVDERNDRVMRWSNTTTRGTVIVGGNGQGEEANQFNTPDDLFFDGYGNFYVVDSGNNRVQRFSID